VKRLGSEVSRRNEEAELTHQRYEKQIPAKQSKRRLDVSKTDCESERKNRKA